MTDTPSTAPWTTKADFLRYIRTSLDWDRLDAIRAEVDESRPNKIKYLDARRWLLRMWRQALELGLDRPPRRRILDLGTGPAYFPYICRLLGHDAVALDQPGILLHDRLAAWIGVDVIPHRIAARTPLPPVAERFDLVTAFRVGFNAKGSRGQRVLFDLDDWTFFLDDVRDHVLRPGGALVLKMIDQRDFTGLQFGDRPLLDLFESRGGRVEPAGRLILFDSLR